MLLIVNDWSQELTLRMNQSCTWLEVKVHWSLACTWTALPGLSKGVGVTRRLTRITEAWRAPCGCLQTSVYQTHTCLAWKTSVRWFLFIRALTQLWRIVDRLVCLRRNRILSREQTPNILRRRKNKNEVQEIKLQTKWRMAPEKGNVRIIDTGGIKRDATIKLKKKRKE